MEQKLPRASFLYVWSTCAGEKFSTGARKHYYSHFKDGASDAKEGELTKVKNRRSVTDYNIDSNIAGRQKLEAPFNLWGN